MKRLSILQGKISQWDGGTTCELAIEPKGASYKERSFDYRISVASIEREGGAFTFLPDYERTLVALSGDILLGREDGDFCLKKHEVMHFDGAESICSLNMAEDFGIMCRKGVCCAEVCVGARGQQPEGEHSYIFDVDDAKAIYVRVRY